MDGALEGLCVYEGHSLGKESLAFGCGEVVRWNGIVGFYQYIIIVIHIRKESTDIVLQMTESNKH